MAKAKLAPRNVATLKAPSVGRVAYFDQARGAPPGFALRVSGSARTYYQTYRLGSRFCWYRIGDAGRLSLSRARQEGRRVLALVDLGHDPQAERERTREQAEAARAAATFATLCRDFLTVREPDLRPKSAAYYRWIVEHHVVGTALGRMTAAEVTAGDIERRLAEVKATTPVTSNRLHQVLTTVCRWARKKGKLSVNPMEAVDRPAKEKSRERVLTDAELPCLWAALGEQEPVIAAAVKLLLLLGQRSTATLEGLRWDALDLKAALPTWTIAGRYQKKGRLHVVPLPAQAVAIIEGLRPLTGSPEHVLAGVDQVNYNRWWRPIRDRTIVLGAERGLSVEHFTRHDLRRTAMTGMTRCEVTRFVAQRVIGHAEQGVGGVYDRHDYLREKAAALTVWAAHVEQVVSGEGRKRASVTPISARRA